MQGVHVHTTLLTASAGTVQQGTAAAVLTWWQACELLAIAMFHGNVTLRYIKHDLPQTNAAHMHACYTQVAFLFDCQWTSVDQGAPHMTFKQSCIAMPHLAHMACAGFVMVVHAAATLFLVRVMLCSGKGIVMYCSTEMSMQSAQSADRVVLYNRMCDLTLFEISQ